MKNVSSSLSHRKHSFKMRDRLFVNCLLNCNYVTLNSVITVQVGIPLCGLDVSAFVLYARSFHSI